MEPQEVSGGSGFGFSLHRGKCEVSRLSGAHKTLQGIHSAGSAEFSRRVTGKRAVCSLRRFRHRLRNPVAPIADQEVAAFGGERRTCGDSSEERLQRWLPENEPARSPQERTFVRVPCKSRHATGWWIRWSRFAAPPPGSKTRQANEVVAGIHVEDFAGDAGGEVRAEEGGGVADFFDGDVLPQRRGLFGLRQHFPEVGDA